MAKWERLITAREQRYLSQAEAAELVNVGLATYQRWEMGKRKPQPHHMRRLSEVFGTLRNQESVDLSEKLSEALDASPFPVPLLREHASSSTSKRVSLQDGASARSIEESQELQTLVRSTLMSYLWSLAFQRHRTGSEKRRAIRQALKEFDTMNADNQNYQITRREALCSLATLPLVTLDLSMPGATLSSSQYSSALAHCSASLASCWELYCSGEANDTALAFKCVAKYLPLLQTMSKNSALYRAEALDLASRYALVKTSLGWGCVGPTATLSYAKEAVALSTETGDLSLQLSALGKLAWTYFYTKNYKPALTAVQQAETLLQSYEQLPTHTLLHPSVPGGMYSTLALVQARNGQSPDVALGKAFDIDLDNEVQAFSLFTKSSRLIETGWTYCYAGNQAKAMENLEKHVDPETLTPRIALQGSGLVETYNIMALSSLKARDRDIEKVLHFWTAGIDGARSLQNKQRFQEALTIYELMEAIWPGEKRIADLQDRIVHWEE